MQTNFYNTAAENLLHNFLEKCYKYAAVPTKTIIAVKIQELCPFKTAYDEDSETLTIDLGEFSVKYKFLWTVTAKGNYNSYNLKDIKILK